MTARLDPPSTPLLRLAGFRLTLLFSALFTLGTLALFGFIYWQTALVETDRVDRMLKADASVIAAQSPERLQEMVASRVMPDLRRVAYVALFTGDKHRVIGNIATWPADLPIDGDSHRLLLPHADGAEAIRVVASRLSDGRVLVIGRNIDSLDNLRQVVMRALRLGLLPAALLSLLAGAVASFRTQRKLQTLHATAERIMRGNLRERLPTRGIGDDFDRLAGSVNQMLDEIARLMEGMKVIGDNIAHDLRTPLTRVRSRLERARAMTQADGGWQEAVDRAIDGLDQALRLITALLRIGEIEGGRRRAAFEDVDLQSLAQEIAELYDPFAEERGLSLRTDLRPTRPIRGDRDLLLEMLSNLVDNAIKFTPKGGVVTLETEESGDAVWLRVQDTGPGIPADQRDAVFQRFHRGDASRGAEGYGLGLSLVEAIVKLHGAQLTLGDTQPGCRFSLRCLPN